MIDVTWETLPLILLTVATAVLGVGRLTRAITYDDFPPSVWLRRKWVALTDGTGWQSWLTCFWCFPFGVSIVCVAWWVGGHYVAWLGWAWWLTWSPFALAYLTSMLVARDEPKD